MSRVSAEAMPSCSHSAVAPAATAWRAMSGVCPDGRNTLTRPTGPGTWASVRYTGSPRMTSACGLTGTIRQPCRCMCAGTYCAALAGTELAPTTVMLS